MFERSMVIWCAQAKCRSCNKKNEKLGVKLKKRIQSYSRFPSYYCLNKEETVFHFYLLFLSCIIKERKWFLDKLFLFFPNNKSIHKISPIRSSCHKLINLLTMKTLSNKRTLLILTNTLTFRFRWTYRRTKQI